MRPSIRTPHYYIRISKPVPSAEWLSVANRLKRHMKACGYVVDEFGDSSAADRLAIRAERSRAIFEGQVVAPGTDAWKDLLRAFFRDEGLTIDHFDTD